MRYKVKRDHLLLKKQRRGSCFNSIFSSLLFLHWKVVRNSIYGSIALKIAFKFSGRVAKKALDVKFSLNLIILKDVCKGTILIAENNFQH